MKGIFSFLLFIGFFSFSSLSIAQNDYSPKIDDLLIEKFKKEKELNCMVSFKQKADLSSARNYKSKEAKGRYVYEQLLYTHQKSQSETIDYLDQHNKTYTPFVIVNALSTTLNMDDVLAIAKITDVSDISWDPDVPMEEPIYASDTKEFENIEWGIAKIKADSVWLMGFEGQNVVIGGQDTGYEWEHQTLRSKYRGVNDTIVDHNYNWHDAIFEINPAHNDSVPDASANPCGLSVPYPCDDHNHGTHTMGTMVGSDSTNLIGVAPKSKWIACRNMDRGIGKPSTYIECFDWFLAPTDLDNMDARPELAPDVINNSWSCPENEGCNESNWALMREAIQNLKSAGIVVVVSAGNEGRNGCATIAKPPAMFEESFAVGATLPNDTITDFSSRGPVIVDSSFLLKPDISAPGANVRSAIRGGQFARFNGTSMAGPHVAGAVALIISANPELRGQVETIENIIENSAVSRIDSSLCFNSSGLDDPNHVYGHGRLDVYQAVQMALQLTSSKDLSVSAGNLKLYPNPAKDILYIDYSSDLNTESYRLSIFNGTGQLLYNSQYALNEVNISNWEPGMYYLKLESKNQTLLEKFIIAH